MEFNPQDVHSFMTEHQVSSADAFGNAFKGHIPANNSYGLKEMDVAIKVSHNRAVSKPFDHDLATMFKNVLKLSHLRHKNIIGLVGYSTSPHHYYLVHELVPCSRLADILEDLTWDHALKILKGLSSAINYFHTHPMGAYVLCNIQADNILVTDDFVAKIVDFYHCAEEGHMFTNGGGAPGYYGLKEGVASKKDDVLAFGILALQLVAKDLRTTFTVREGPKLSLHHILDKYVPVFRECGDLAHPSYGNPKEARKVSELIVACLKKDGRIDIKCFYKEIALVCFTRLHF